MTIGAAGSCAISASQGGSASFRGATVPGSYVYSPPAGTVLNAGQGQTLSTYVGTVDVVSPAPLLVAPANVRQVVGGSRCFRSKLAVIGVAAI